MSIKKRLISTLSTLTLGHSITESMRIGSGFFSFQKYFKALSRYRKIRYALKHDLQHFFSSQQFYLENFSPQSTPLALISNINRSHSSFLLHYFDGHPQLNVSPIELNLNQSDIDKWPDFELDLPPNCWFDILCDLDFSSSISRKFANLSIPKINYPFVFSHQLHKALFLHYFSLYKAYSKREIFDIYFSAFFAAWLNNQNISLVKKSYHVISSKLSLTNQNVNDFFKIFPDGRLILILCDPTEWLQSKLTMIPNFSTVNHEIITNLLKDFENYIETILDAKKKFNKKVCIIRHIDLIKNIKNVMLYLSKFMHIDFNEILLSTTFNKIQITCDSIDVRKNGVFNKEANSLMNILSDGDFKAIDEFTDKVYNRAIKNLDPF